MLLHHPHGPLADLRRELVRRLHGCTLSKVGASSKPGAVHTVTQQNAALVEESAAAAESLRQQAMGLNAVVQRFSMAAVPG